MSRWTGAKILLGVLVCAGVIICVGYLVRGAPPVDAPAEGFVTYRDSAYRFAFNYPRTETINTTPNFAKDESPIPEIRLRVQANPDLIAAYSEPGACDMYVRAGTHCESLTTSDGHRALFLTNSTTGRVWGGLVMSLGASTVQLDFTLSCESVTRDAAGYVDHCVVSKARAEQLRATLLTFVGG